MNMKKYILTIASALLALGACTHNEPQLADAIARATDPTHFSAGDAADDGADATGDDARGAGDGEVR